MGKYQDISVLIVDKKLDNFQMVKTITSDMNVSCIHSKTGTKALGFIVENSIALVILAERLVDMNGYEAAEYMRSNISTRHIPIIIITESLSDQFHIFRGYEIGAVDYIPNPPDQNVLLNKIKIFLDIYEHKMALERKNLALKRANRIILDQQQSLVERERLKLLLQLSGTTAHDLEHPLSSLMDNIAELMNRVNKDDELQHLLVEIKQDVGRISEKISTIRNLPLEINVPSEQRPDMDRLATGMIHILVIEDEDQDFDVLKKMLDKHDHIYLTQAENIDQSIDLLETDLFDMIITDYILSDGTCFNLITRLKQLRIEIPIAVVTGLGSEIIASQVIQAGAYDYLPKNKLNGYSIYRVIENIIEKSSLRKEIQRVNEKMARMATLDKLTGVYNRRFFNDAIEAEMERAKRYENELVLLFIDLDFFKQVNDNYGHAAGDYVLKEVGRIFTRVKRKNDIVCRYGGEEFAIILPNICTDNGFGVAEKYRKEIENRKFEFKHFNIFVTISVGLASSTEINGVKELLEAADKALYKAKDTGRNKVVVYD